MAGFFRRLFGSSNTSEMVGAIEIPGEEPSLPAASRSAAGVRGQTHADSAGIQLNEAEYQLAISGHVLECIEAYRNRTGSTIEQTRAVVEPVLAAMPNVPLPSENSGAAMEEVLTSPTYVPSLSLDDDSVLAPLNEEEKRLVDGGQAPEAVKAYRQRMGANLIQSKRAVDSYMGM